CSRPFSPAEGSPTRPDRADVRRAHSLRPMPALRDVLALVEEWYPARWADDWDAVGLVCGDPDQKVRRILLAVDPVATVAEEAERYDLLVVHHPLFLAGTHSVAATTPKGR